MSKSLSYEKPSMNSKSDKAKTGGIKGFIMKIIDNSGNANSNSIKSGSDFKTNSNLFAKSNMVQNFPTTSSSSSSATTTTTTLKSHDESIEQFKSNASSSNKNLSTGAASIQSPSSSTLLDYNSL